MTLLEICICIALIGLFSSFLGLKIHRLLEKHTFEKGAQRLQTQLIFCQKMALTHQMDMLFILRQEKEGLFFDVDTDEEVSLEKKNFEKGFVQQIEARVDGEVQKEIKVTFSSTGGSFPKVHIEVVSMKNPKWKRTILSR